MDWLQACFLSLCSVLSIGRSHGLVFFIELRQRRPCPSFQCASLFDAHRDEKTENQDGARGSSQLIGGSEGNVSPEGRPSTGAALCAAGQGERRIGERAKGSCIVA